MYYHDIMFECSTGKKGAKNHCAGQPFCFFKPLRLLFVFCLFFTILSTGLNLLNTSVLAEQDGEKWRRIQVPEKIDPVFDSRINSLLFDLNSVHPLFLGGKISIRAIIESDPGRPDSVIQAIEVLAEVESIHRGLIQANVPVVNLAPLSNIPGIRHIRFPSPSVESVVGEGLSLSGAFVFYDEGISGSGVRIGILDRGFEGLAECQAQGELPQVIRTFRTEAAGRTKHGTACAELAYDIAPGAEFYLAGFETEVEFADAVDWMIENHIDIISCSINWPIGGPGDGSGFICDIINEARQAGIFWVNSAGDAAQRHWGGEFSDTDYNGIHNFYSSDEGNTLDVISGDKI